MEFNVGYEIVNNEIFMIVNEYFEVWSFVFRCLIVYDIIFMIFYYLNDLSWVLKFNFFYSIFIYIIIICYMKECKIKIKLYCLRCELLILFIIKSNNFCKLWFEL